MKISTPKGATQRQLNERELHRELRRAERAIEMATTMMSLDQTLRLHKALVINKIADDEDWLGADARHVALNRIKPKRDYLKIILVALCILLGWAWYSAQLDRDLFIAQITLGDRHG